jgi:hypothetical protein
MDFAREHLECERQECVAHEDCGCFAVDFVARGPPAAEVIIIHGRQVVVHERVGMAHFDGARGRKGVLDAAATGFGRHQDKPRA